MKPPIRCGVTVTGLRRDESGEGLRRSRHRQVRSPPSVSSLPPVPISARSSPTRWPRTIDFFQVHANAYKGPDQLPAGAVLIVGSGASGAQIAEELVRAGRQVYLSVGRHKRMPRRYRGRDLIWWLREMGLEQTPVEQRGPDATLPLITGAYGGHTIDFREFAAQGMTLVGRLQSASDGILSFCCGSARKPRVWRCGLQRLPGEGGCASSSRQKMALPAEPQARAILPDPPCVVDPMRQLDSRAAGLSSVIWATGYTFDFSWIDLPVLERTRRATAPARRRRRARHLLPRPAVAVEDELVIPVGCRRRCGAAGGPYSDRTLNSHHEAEALVPVRTSLRTIVLTATAMLCFAANSILCRLALAPGQIDPATFTTLRVLSAALMLSLVV